MRLLGGYLASFMSQGPSKMDQVFLVAFTSSPCRGITFVTTLMPLAIPEQPKDNWFNALADTPAVASPLEMLAWLHVPNSTSLGKRTFHLETGPNIPKYGLTEYKALTGLGEPEDGPMELSRSNEQDNPEDREAKKAWIQTVIGTEIHRHMTVQVPDSPPTVYKA